VTSTPKSLKRFFARVPAASGAGMLFAGGGTVDPDGGMQGARRGQTSSSTGLFTVGFLYDHVPSVRTSKPEPSNPFEVARTSVTPRRAASVFACSSVGGENTTT
jgi:hypothetical protein